MDGQRSRISIHQKLTKSDGFPRRSKVAIPLHETDFARYRLTFTASSTPG
jgi:hypothetical protein